MVDLADRYSITSNRESGFGRYDILLEPKVSGADGTGKNCPGDAIINNCKSDAIIIEFKGNNPKRENNLEDTVASALEQIDQMQYETALRQRGIPKERIRKYGFAFRGKEVLIG